MMIMMMIIIVVVVVVVVVVVITNGSTAHCLVLTALFQFLDAIHIRLDSLDGGTA
jgi:hypothetical protein